MGSGNRSIRFKIFLLLLLPLLSLSALWGFVLNLTVGDGAALLRADTLYQTVGVTSTELGLQLQAERARNPPSRSAPGCVTSELGAQRAAHRHGRRRVPEGRRPSRAAARSPPTCARRWTTAPPSWTGSPDIRAGIDDGQHSTAERAVELQPDPGRGLPSLRPARRGPRPVDLPAGHAPAVDGQRPGDHRQGERADQRGADRLPADRAEERNAFAEYVATRRFLHARGLSVAGRRRCASRTSRSSTPRPSGSSPRWRSASSRAPATALPPDGDATGRRPSDRLSSPARPARPRLLRGAGRRAPVGGHRDHDADRHRRRPRPDRRGRLDHPLGPLRPPAGRRAGRAALGRAGPGRRTAARTSWSG